MLLWTITYQWSQEPVEIASSGISLHAGEAPAHSLI